jgi:ABC-type multidrug transport system fused ATPase/permease subunit
MRHKKLAKKFVTHNDHAFRSAVWFYHDFVVRFRARLIVITGLGFVTASLQATALFGLQHVLKQLGGNQPEQLSLLNITISADYAGHLGALFFLVVLGGSATLTLIQGRLILDLWYRYQLHGTDSLLLAIQGACQRGAVSPEDLEPRYIRRLLRQVQRLGAFSRFVVGSITPALRFLAFSAYAVVSNPLLTLLLLLALIPTAGLTLLFFARKASHCARAVIDLAGEETKELDKRLKDATEGRYLQLKERQSIEDTAVERRAKAVTGRLLWVEYSRFMTTVITIFVLFIFFVIIINTEVFGDNSWASIVTYVLALYIAFTQLITLASSISNFGRFYPSVAEQKAIVGAFLRATSAADIWRVLNKAGVSPAQLDDDESGI